MSLLSHLRVGHQSAGRDLATVAPAVPDQSGVPLDERIRAAFNRHGHAGTSDRLKIALKASEDGWSAGALVSGPRELEG